MAFHKYTCIKINNIGFKGLRNYYYINTIYHTFFHPIACTITPLNPTNGLTATGGAVVSGTTNVKIQCTCSLTDNLRWYFNGNFLVQSSHPTQYVAGSPYLLLGTTVRNVQNVSVVIPTFTDSSNGTYDCGIFINNTQFTSTSPSVVLTIGELMINIVSYLYVAT